MCVCLVCVSDVCGVCGVYTPSLRVGLDGSAFPSVISQNRTHDFHTTFTDIPQKHGQVSVHSPRPAKLSWLVCCRLSLSHSRML